jgi:hypothetical protein
VWGRKPKSQPACYTPVVEALVPFFMQMAFRRMRARSARFA